MRVRQLLRRLFALVHVIQANNEASARVIHIQVSACVAKHHVIFHDDVPRVIKQPQAKSSIPLNLVSAQKRLSAQDRNTRVRIALNCVHKHHQ